VDLSNSEECGFSRKPIPVDGTAKRDFKASFSGLLFFEERVSEEKSPNHLFPHLRPLPEKRRGSRMEN